MCRGGSPGPWARARLLGVVAAARILVVVAALAMVAGGASASLHSGITATGFEMVICSDGVAKTVVIDTKGNPTEPSGEEACAGPCLCCPAATMAALPTEVTMLACVVLASSTAAPRPRAVVLAPARRALPDPRAPPAEEKA